MNSKLSNDSAINKALKIFLKQLNKDFTKSRNQTKIAVDNCPNKVKFEDAAKQVRKF